MQGYQMRRLQDVKTKRQLDDRLVQIFSGSRGPADYGIPEAGSMGPGRGPWGSPGPIRPGDGPLHARSLWDGEILRGGSQNPSGTGGDGWIRTEFDGAESIGMSTNEGRSWVEGC